VVARRQGKRPCEFPLLHIGVDDQGQIIASSFTASHEKEPSQVPALLPQIEREIDPFIGDGMSDPAPVYAALEHHAPGARAIIPPRKDAVLRPMGTTAPTQRDPQLLESGRVGRFVWKRTSGYYAQSHAGNAFSRFKRIFGGGGRAQREECQEREGALACEVLNRMQAQGRPQSYPVR
jgi:hypothetical protein